MTDTPILLLDVDGVIAPTSSKPSYPGPVRWVDLFPGGMHFPARVLDRLVDLHRRGVVAVEWATSWQEQVTADLAPALGLPSWPVHTLRSAPQHHGATEVTDGDWWKARVALGRLDTGRRVIWCDDDITLRADRDLLRHAYGERLLVVCPPGHIGLTEADLDHIEAWAAAGTTAQTQAEPVSL